MADHSDLNRAFSALPPGSAPGPDCPASETLFEAAAGRLSPEQTAPLLDHTATCAWCAMSWALAREVHTDPQATDTPVIDLSAERHRRSRLPWVGIAVALAATLLLWVPSPDPVVYRAPEQGTVTALTDTAHPLPHDAFTLSWQASPADALYDVTVSTERFQTISRAVNLEVPSWTVPASDLGPLPQGTRLIWTVEVRDTKNRIARRGSFIAVLGD